MNIEHENHGHYTSSDSTNITKSSDSSSRFSDFIEHVHSSRTLYLVSGVLQIVLGLGVIFGALTGFIAPLWFATSISMFASISCLTGLYLLYTVNHAGNGPEQLIRDAMRRIMNAQN